MPSLKNISWDRLLREGAVTYPADAPDKPGNEILFAAGYPTKSGRGRIVPANIRPPDELPDDQYPYVLSTGRVVLEGKAEDLLENEDLRKAYLGR